MDTTFDHGGPGRRRNGRLKVPKTAEVIARWMRRTIHENDVQPGAVLPSETALREQFQVSRPTVREALRLLEAQQLVHVARGATGGARYSLPEVSMVAEHTGIYLETRRTTQRDLTEARLNIEPRVIGFIAAEARDSDLSALAASVDAHDAAVDDLAAFSREHERFYELLAGVCPNQTLALFLLIFREIIGAQTEMLGEEIMALAPRSRDRLVANAGVKRRLLDLIHAGDAAGAEALWRRHLEAQLRELDGSGRSGQLVKTY